MSAVKENILMYKDKPLVRKDRTICYGNVSDKYILVLTVLETKKEKGLEIASKVFVQIQSTVKNAENKDNVIKYTEKDSLYEAFDIGETWLDKALRD